MKKVKKKIEFFEDRGVLKKRVTRSNGKSAGGGIIPVKKLEEEEK